jgi:hypothetical protein
VNDLRAREVRSGCVEARPGYCRRRRVPGREHLECDDRRVDWVRHAPSSPGQVIASSPMTSASLGSACENADFGGSILSGGIVRLAVQHVSHLPGEFRRCIRHPAWTPRAERPPRAHASHAEAGGHETGGRQRAPAAGLLRCLQSCYNRQRPHQALGMKVPGELYAPSPRPYRGLPTLDYPLHDWTRP